MANIKHYLNVFKKAILTLKLIREDFDGTGNMLADGRDAIDLAIKALEFVINCFPITFIDYLIKKGETRLLRGEKTHE